VGFTLVFMGYCGVGFLMEILGLSEWNIVYGGRRDVKCIWGAARPVGLLYTESRRLSLDVNQAAQRDSID